MYGTKDINEATTTLNVEQASAMRQLFAEMEKGWQSVRHESDWISEEEMYRALGINQ